MDTSLRTSGLGSNEGCMESVSYIDMVIISRKDSICYKKAKYEVNLRRKVVVEQERNEGSLGSVKYLEKEA